MRRDPPVKRAVVPPASRYAADNVTPVVTGSGTAPKIISNGAKLSTQAGSHMDCSGELLWFGEYSVTVSTSRWLT
jgi:hypothetical protein